MKKINGIVKNWNEENGYGFITIENNEDIFVHFSGIEEENIYDLIPGEEVELMIIKGSKGLQATAVTVR